MTKRRSSSIQGRGKKERLLRYILRRKPCAFITLAEVISLVVLASLFALCFYFYLEMKNQNEIYDAEDAILKNMNNSITFAHCNYVQSDPAFNNVFCDKRIDVEAYAWRHYRLDSTEKDETCMDIQEQVNCHEGVKMISKPFTFHIYPACAGLNSKEMPNAESSELTIKTPKLNETELSKHQNEIVLAQELFAICPKCKVRSRQFKVGELGSERCMVKLKTIEKGWPAYAEECDDVIQILHASSNCAYP